MSTPFEAAALRFSRFELFPQQRRLLVEGVPVALGARAFDLLLVLVERPGSLLRKQELLDRVWPGQVVEEANIAVQVNALRKVLGSEVIATLPGRGYRFEGLIEAGDVARPVPAAPLPAAVSPTNLPTALPVLFGRCDEVVALGEMLTAHRLVSVVGAGGIGKTLLAQHLLDARRGLSRHGVCWVELGQLVDAAALPGSLAAALGVRPGSGDPLVQLAAAVAPLQVLLALDNAEHLVAEVARLAEFLLQAAPGLRLLVTSQTPLNVPAERVYRLGALAVPLRPLPATEAQLFGAVALFVERAQAADARFVLTDANAPTVIQLCRSLDGIALAIELAAARAPALGVPKLAESMHDRLKLLTSNRNRAAPARQQTLRAALEWSHRLLCEREQVVFRRLAVLAGSAALELVLQVLADPAGGSAPAAIDGWQALDALCVLVDRSLVAMVTTDDRARPRYRLLDSPRAFALERLDAAGEVEALRRRHTLALAARFDAAWHERYSGRIGLDDWRQSLMPDFDDAREAFAWAAAAGDLALALTLGATLLQALPGSLHAERVALVEACGPMIVPGVPPALRLRVWLAFSADWSSAGKQRRRIAAEQALALARTLHGADPDTGAEPVDRLPLYLALALYVQVQPDLTEAEAALAELRCLEEPAWPAQRLLRGAEAETNVARRHSDPAEAVRAARRLLALSREAGCRDAFELNALVDAQLAAGDAAGAARTGLSQVEALEAGRNEFQLVHARLNLCAAWLALGDVVQARPVAEAGWAQAPNFELQPYWADYLALLASLEARPLAAAQLAGYSQASYARRCESRQTNEAAAFERVCSSARIALGEAAFAAAFAEGGRLRDTDVAALAFGQSPA